MKWTHSTSSSNAEKHTQLSGKCHRAPEYWYFNQITLIWSRKYHKGKLHMEIEWQNRKMSWEASGWSSDAVGYSLAATSFMPLNHNGACGCKQTQSPCGKSILVGEAPTQNMTHITQNSNHPTMELLYPKGHLTVQVASAYAASHPLPLKSNKRLIAPWFSFEDTVSVHVCG